MARDLIFLPLGGGVGDRAAAGAARALAETLEAAVEAVFVGLDDTTLVMAAGDGSAAMSFAALKEERTRGEAAARAVATEFEFALSVHDGPRAQAAWRARLAILAIVDAESARGEGPLWDVLETLLLEERVPVLVPRGTHQYKRIAIAWDGSREAAKALKAAEPLLAAAHDVLILQAPDAVDPKDAASADPERARHWITARNADAKIEMMRLKIDPSSNLAAAAQGAGADLIVAGAYGHARLREAVFGGATRSLLRAKSPSLLLAH